MAGDWIKMELTTPDKPEVFAIAEAFDIDPDAAFGKLFRVWAWFDQHTENGNAPTVTKTLINRITSVIGFADAMVDAGWLVQTDDGLEVPNFERHNGETGKKRALTAKRQAKHKNKVNEKGNGKVTPAALPKEEKRREDIKTLVPYEKIKNLSNKILSDLPACKQLTDTRKKQILKIWNSKNENGEPRNNLEWWESFFTFCKTIKFLHGENDRGWVANLEWITKPANFIKIIEGNYK